MHIHICADEITTALACWEQLVHTYYAATFYVQSLLLRSE
jgi:hypothetical protein